MQHRHTAYRSNSIFTDIVIVRAYHIRISKPTFTVTPTALGCRQKHEWWLMSAPVVSEQTFIIRIHKQSFMVRMSPSIQPNI